MAVCIGFTGAVGAMAWKSGTLLSYALRSAVLAMEWQLQGHFRGSNLHSDSLASLEISELA